MITHGLSHQMSHEILGHYVVRNVTKLQSCSVIINVLLAKKHCENILTRIVVRFLFYLIVH